MTVFYVHVASSIIHSRSRCSICSTYASISFIGAETNIGLDILRRIASSKIVRARSNACSCLWVNDQRATSLNTKCATSRFRPFSGGVLAGTRSFRSISHEAFTVTSCHCFALGAETTLDSILTWSRSSVFSSWAITTALRYSFNEKIIVR